MNNETKERVTCNGKLGVRASGLQVAPLALAIGFPDSDEPAARFMEWYNPAHWIWWGRGLGTFIGILVREREEAVRRAERERIAGIVEGMVGYDVRTEADEFYGRDGIETVDRDALLAKLREAKP